MAKLTWVTNVCDPTAENARTFSLARNDKEWKKHLKYIAKHTKGKPKASKVYTTVQLESMNIIGLYK